MFPTIYAMPYFTITTLGVFAILAFVFGMLAFTKLSLRRQLDLQFMADHFWFFILFTLLGARLQSVIENWNLFSENIGLIFYGVWLGGLGLWGGLIGFIFALYYQCKKHKEATLRWLDVTSVGLMLVLSISYIGMFFDGSGYGSPTNLPWGVSFENIGVPYTIPIHPTQIYLSLLALLAFFIGRRVLIRKKTNGITSLITVTIFALGYFYIDFLRGDSTLTFNGLRLSQYLSIFTIVIIFLPILIQKFKNKK